MLYVSSMERPPCVAAEVVEWLGEEGWGVIESEDVPERIWVHFSAIEMTGYRSLIAGEGVEAYVEGPLPFEQHGYRYSATRVVPLSH